MRFEDPWARFIAGEPARDAPHGHLKRLPLQRAGSTLWSGHRLVVSPHTRDNQRQPRPFPYRPHQQDHDLQLDYQGAGFDVSAFHEAVLGGGLPFPALRRRANANSAVIGT